jgi:hypothetical protein
MFELQRCVGVICDQDDHLLEFNLLVITTGPVFKGQEIM